MKRRTSLSLAALNLLAASSLRAASLDISTDYRMRALSYTNLDLNANTKNDHSLLSQDARLGFVLKNITLGDSGEKGTMDIVLKLHALGVAGSTSPFAAPFDRIANNYPSSNFIPFIENALLNIHQLGGKPWDMTIGRQTFRLGSGLLLDDDGAGFTGITARASLPWWDIKTEAFIFQVQNRQQDSNNLDVFGLSIAVPTEGTWQLNQMVEKDRAPQTTFVTDPQCAAAGCPISRATRYFSSVRYQLNFSEIVFDGEAALEKGAATPTGPDPLPGHITYNANAQTLRAKWKQTLYKDIRGIARVSVVRGSGDNPGTRTTDEGFFPSHGHRYDGMERAGMGEFFGATPYDGFGGHSTSTANGLSRGASGILGVGLGLTPPAYKGFVLDIDYYLFQADRNIHGDRNLGSEWDFRLRYDVGDRLRLSASAGLFKAGSVLDTGKSSAHRYMFEAVGRF